MQSGFLRRFGKLFSRPFLLCLGSFVACFFLALLYFFPLQPFARLIEQQAAKQGYELRIIDPQLRFLLGVGAEELQIGHAQIPHPPLQFKAVGLRPLWLSLISENPGLSFEAKAYQGLINGTAYRNGRLQATADHLQISEPLGPELPLVLAGELLTGEFAGTLPLAGKNRSRLQLEMGALSLAGMQTFGSSNDLLPIGSLSCTLEATGPLLQISNLLTRGPAFDLTGSGSLRLGRSTASSSLNLKLVLTPKADLDPALKDLLSLLYKPQRDGSYQFNLRGALSNLRIN